MNGVNLSSTAHIDAYNDIATFNDDVALRFGTGGTVQILYETADANANCLFVVFPEDGATDVPVIVFGDANILNVDLGWFNGISQPTIAIVNDAKDAYVTLDSGDDAVASSKGLYFKAATDEDIELLNLSVGGTPRIFWDESEDRWSTAHGFTFTGGSLKGHRAIIEHHTADDVLTLGESYSTHTNLGDTGTQTITLPASALGGETFTFAVMAAYELRVEIGAASKSFYANGSKTTDDGGADLYMMADSIGETLTLQADGNGDWFVIATYGTWSVVQL